MYTSAGLQDVHVRTHRSIEMLLDHCAGLSEEELNRELAGFSYPTVRLQLHHMLGAERYWLGVLEGRLDLDDDGDAHESVDALRGLRAAVAAATTAYLAARSDAELSRPCTVTQWTGDTVDVVPAHVLLRTQTHMYQHHGEIASMSRLLGRPFPSGLDFPLR